jgi:hypothetical protein
MTEGKTDPGVKKTIEEQLDEALADSFPASDPVSFVTSQMEEDWNEQPAPGLEPTPVGGNPAPVEPAAGKRDPGPK